MSTDTLPTLSVFYSYAHEDKALRDELDKHLGPLRRLGWIRSWHDRDILPGMEWQQELDTHLRTANIILLLVSPDFIASEYCYGLEMQEALRKHAAGEAVVIPIILRPVDWQETPLGTLQGLPPEGKPITSWLNRDEAYEQVARELRRVVTALRHPVLIVASPRDQSLVARLSQALDVRSIAVWNHDAELEQATPESQEEAIRQTLQRTSTVVLIASPDARHSRAVKAHLDLAAIYQRKPIAVWVDGDIWEASVPEGWDELECIDAREPRYETAMRELEARLTHRASIASSPSGAESESEPRNPYKGLRAFRYEDTRDFFGRDALVQELVSAVQRSLHEQQQDKGGSRLLAVIGPSGSGKSSVVMAGLLARLHTGFLPGSREWVYLEPMVPGTHPLEALTVTLSHHLPERSFVSLREDLDADSSRGLHLLASHIAKQPGTHVVLFVDQFEELFAQTTSESERQQFIDLLVAAVTDPYGPLLVILTLRADFSDRPMYYPTLQRLMMAQQVLVLPMEASDLRAVIEQPAALPDVHITFEETLVSELLFEMRGQLGALPLLQFTLEQLFERRRGHLLTLDAYHELGGVKGALTKQAEETYASFPTDGHRRLARALFVRLIDPGATEQDTTRRRAALSEFSLAEVSQTRQLQEVTAAFIAVRLLTTNEIAGTRIIEVSHEALIREWPRLAGWLRETRDDIRLQQAISKDAIEWERRNKPGDRLYRGSQLKEARAWARRNIPSGNEVAFLSAGTAYRMRYFVTILIIVLLLLSTTGLAGWVFLSRPDPNRVTTLNDDGSGSLRQDIAVAPAGSTIMFDTSLHGTIVLSSGDLTIAKHLTIHGPGAGMVSISGGKSGHIVHVLQGVLVTISDLTFKNSISANGFIDNEGMLTLNNSTVSGNTASGGTISYGGGILNGGTLTVNNSTISGNTSGGIRNAGTLTVNNSTISGNTSDRSGGGGGIDSSGGTAIITNSTISDNQATDGGGGIINWSSGTMIIANSTVLDNRSTDGSGGGIYNDGSSLTLSNSSVSDNTAAVAGGGIVNYSGQLTVSNSTISGNTAAGGSGSDGGGGISDWGGGGNMTITNSTISDNTAVGSNGGGITTANDKRAITSTSVTLLFCTVYGNTAGVGGGIWIENFDLPDQQPVALEASIVAGNNAHSAPDIAGPLSSLGYNLIKDRSGATFFGSPKMLHTDALGASPTDLGIDPMLRDNGGSVRPHTWTHKLLPGSPAIDLIPSDVCMSFQVFNDQRGVKRPQGKGCDSGAYQSIE